MKKVLSVILLSLFINSIIIAQESRLSSFLHHSEKINIVVEECTQNELLALLENK